MSAVDFRDEDSAFPPSMGLFARLRDRCGDTWSDYVDHSFVQQLARGTLPEACFRRYLVQDYLFLIQFARAYALAGYKADGLDDLRTAASSLSAITDHEMQLHVSCCAGWGLGETDLANAAEAAETIAYTRFVLDAGLRGDLLDLITALAPCVVGYAEIGARLGSQPIAAGHPYRAWIETYASAAYQEVAAGHISWMERVFAKRGGAARMAQLHALFTQATRLEAAFWSMGLNPDHDLD